MDPRANRQNAFSFFSNSLDVQHTFIKGGEREITYDPESASSSIKTSTLPFTIPPPIRPPSDVLALPMMDTVSTLPSADFWSNSLTARFASPVFLNFNRTVTLLAPFGPWIVLSIIDPHRLKIA